MSKSSPKNWEIRQGRTRDTSSYFEMDVRKEYLVVNKLTGKVFKSFSRSEYANAQGSYDSGIDDLSFNEDETVLTATYVDGKVEKFDLPI